MTFENIIIPITIGFAILGVIVFVMIAYIAIEGFLFDITYRFERYKDKRKNKENE